MLFNQTITLLWPVFRIQFCNLFILQLKVMYPYNYTLSFNNDAVRQEISSNIASYMADIIRIMYNNYYFQ